jgi:hypothetical protein
VINIRRFNNLALLGCCFAAVGLAQQVSMQLIPPTASGPVLDGVYINPYTALIGPANQTGSLGSPIVGTPTLVICDDYLTDVSLSTPAWQADATNVASITGPTPNTTVKFDQTNAALQQSQYTVAAVLATQILSAQQQANITSEGELSFALWGLFDPALALDSVASADLTSAENTAAGLTTSNFSNVTVYTPIVNQPGGINASQEYIVVRTPEPAEMAVFGVEFSGLLGLVYVLRRRSARAAR